MSDKKDKKHGHDSEDPKDSKPQPRDGDSPPSGGENEPGDPQGPGK